MFFNDNQEYIGKLVTSYVPYYDSMAQSTKCKSRPFLIIGVENKFGSTDFNVLPVSTVTNKNNLSKEFDIEISGQNQKELLLNKVSYIRCHKQTIIHRNSIGKIVSDLKSINEAVYKEVKNKVRLHNATLFITDADSNQMEKEP